MGPGRPWVQPTYVDHTFDEVTRLYGLDYRMVVRRPAGLVALSADVQLRLEGIRLMPDGHFELPPDYSWVKQYPLVKRIGKSIEVYDIGGDAVSGEGNRR